MQRLSCIFAFTLCAISGLASAQSGVSKPVFQPGVVAIVKYANGNLEQVYIDGRASARVQKLSLIMEGSMVRVVGNAAPGASLKVITPFSINKYSAFPVVFPKHEGSSFDPRGFDIGATLVGAVVVRGDGQRSVDILFSRSLRSFQIRDRDIDAGLQLLLSRDLELKEADTALPFVFSIRPRNDIQSITWSLHADFSRTSQKSGTAAATDTGFLVEIPSGACKPDSIYTLRLQCNLTNAVSIRRDVMITVLSSEKAAQADAEASRAAAVAPAGFLQIAARGVVFLEREMYLDYYKAMREAGLSIEEAMDFETW
jgi:hypothetical protein